MSNTLEQGKIVTANLQKMPTLVQCLQREVWTLSCLKVDKESL
jgi:hypothetical protein